MEKSYKKPRKKISEFLSSSHFRTGRGGGPGLPVYVIPGALPPSLVESPVCTRPCLPCWREQPERQQCCQRAADRETECDDHWGGSRIRHRVQQGKSKRNPHQESPARSVARGREKTRAENSRKGRSCLKVPAFTQGRGGPSDLRWRAKTYIVRASKQVSQEHGK